MLAAKYRIAKILKHRRSMPSFTLVELLVVIAIIGVLAGMLIYTMAGARRDALIIRTQGTIKKINDVVLAKWEEFRYRGVRLEIDKKFLVPYQTPQGYQLLISPREGARTRMLALRDLMRMEMPDRFTDILYPPISYRVGIRTADNYINPPDATNDDCIVDIPRDVSALYLGYRRTFVDESSISATSLNVNPYPASEPVVQVGVLKVNNTTNQAAELLYELVASSTYQGGSALEFFRPSEIGDTDGDGYNEFIDAWGKPIYWIRWPAGYVSPLNDGLTPDPLDPLKTDWRWGGTGVKPWMLVPLIISAGPDGAFDTVFDLDVNGANYTPTTDPASLAACVRFATNVWTGNTDPGGKNAQRLYGPYYYPDPYATFGAYQLGQVFDIDGDGIDGSIDNITNYELVLQ